MRAITCTGYGRPTEVLHLDDIGDPAVADDHVLVKVRAAALNPADWHLIRGVPYVARLQVGLRRPRFEVPGSDFAGVVEAVGPLVTTLQPGDEVYGTTFMAGFGAFAEKVAVPERLVARRPRSVSFEEAAGIPLAASTALQALRDHGRVRPGQRVLVVGASGGVGTYAVQLAKHLGADVTAVCSTRNLDLVRSLGADRAVDYTTTDVVDTVDRYDVVLQLAGTASASRLVRVLADGGTLLQLSGDSANRWFGPLGRVLAGQVRGRLTSRRVVTFTVQPSRDDLDLVATLVDGGVLRTHLDATYDLDDVPAALERVEAGRTRGKAIVSITTGQPERAENGRAASSPPA